MTTTLHPMTITVRQGRGYRIIRRVRLHQPAETPLQRLWTQIWCGGSAEQVHARNLYRQTLKAQYDEQRHYRIHLP